MEMKIKKKISWKYVYYSILTSILGKLNTLFHKLHNPTKFILNFQISSTRILCDWNDLELKSEETRREREREKKTKELKNVGLSLVKIQAMRN
jgi:hypothetical protein